MRQQDLGKHITIFYFLEFCEDKAAVRDDLKNFFAVLNNVFNFIEVSLAVSCQLRAFPRAPSVAPPLQFG